MSHDVKISDKERELLRKKLEDMVELEKREEILKTKKKEIEQNLNIFRPELDSTLETFGKRRVTYSKTLVSRVPKSQHRKPTLEITYQAIQNVLGKSAMENVKKAIKEQREQMKNQCEMEKTLKVIRTKDLRKPRKDKNPERQVYKTRKSNNNNNKQEEGSKKLKYMKRQSKS